MNNYHNGDISLEEAWELAIFINKKLIGVKGLYTDKVEKLLSYPEYVLYDRNPCDVYLEQNEASFIARNERIEPSGSGI